MYHSFLPLTYFFKDGHIVHCPHCSKTFPTKWELKRWFPLELLYYVRLTWVYRHIIKSHPVRGPTQKRNELLVMTNFMSSRENSMSLNMEKVFQEFYASAGHIWPILCNCHRGSFQGEDALYYAVGSIATKYCGYTAASRFYFGKLVELIVIEQSSKGNEYVLIVYLYLVPSSFKWLMRNWQAIISGLNEKKNGSFLSTKVSSLNNDFRVFRIPQRIY